VPFSSFRTRWKHPLSAYFVFNGRGAVVVAIIEQLRIGLRCMPLVARKDSNKILLGVKPNQGSNLKMTTSCRTIDSTNGDHRAAGTSNNSITKHADVKREDLQRTKESSQLSDTTTNTTVGKSETADSAKASSAGTKDFSGSSEDKEKHNGESSDTLVAGNEGNDRTLSTPSSSQHERDSSKMASTSSSPSCPVATPRIHLFSPPSSSIKQSNHRVDYDELNLNDTIMGPGMGFEFEEEASPCRDVVRSSPCIGPGVQRKRESSDLDRPSSAKRLHVPHHRFSRSQETTSTNNLSSSTPRTGTSPGYQNFYGHPHSVLTYHGGNRTPSRGNPQQGGYHSGYSSYYRYRSHEHSQWDSRSLLSPGLGTPKTTYPSFECDDHTPASPPSSPGTRAASKIASASTPAAKSPFRSPRRDSGCHGSESKNNAVFRPSPYFRRCNFSFEIDTPSGTLPTEDYSPTGPTFELLGEDAPFLEDDLFGSTLMGINRSPSHGNSDGTPSPSSAKRDRRPQRSPMSPDVSAFMSFEQLGAIHGDSRPPLHHDLHRDTSADRRYPNSEGHNDTMESGARKHPKASAVTLSCRKGEPPSSRLDPRAEPKQLWPPSSDAALKDRTCTRGGPHGAVRLEIGGTGSLTTRKTLEGINNMMQQSSTSHNKSSIERKNVVSGYGTTPGRGQPSSQLQRTSHHPYSFGEINTPSKGYSHMRAGHARGRHNSYPPPGAQGMKPYPRNADHSYSGVPPKSIYMSHHPHRDNNPLSHQHNGVPSSVGKENNKKKAAPKRSSCNCKKSKCLKLYCECFAAERFCQGCNCVDCRNTPEFGEDREKAIKDTRAKNSKAFQPKLVIKNSQGAEAAQKVHNTGCKCKKSQCLKKYCECFNAGVFCGSKCKCTNCMNYAGSQQLADKRNKMKDPVGAEYALRASHDQWKSGSSGLSRKSLSQTHRRQPMPSPVIGMPPHHHIVHPSPRGYPAHGSHGYLRSQHSQRHYMGPPVPPMNYHGHHQMGYPPIPVTHGYPQPPQRMPPAEGPPHSMYRPFRSSRPPSSKPMPTPKFKDHPKNTAGSPRTPGVRKAFDPATNRKKRKVPPGELEPTQPYFGDGIPEQPKITGLAVFSFLSNDDLYHASLVSKSWSKLAMDEELWKF